MGAEERRRWSSHVRRDLVGATMALLAAPDSYGTAIFGSRGVGKSTLAKFVEVEASAKMHVVRLYGTSLDKAVPYGTWGLYLARMDNFTANSPLSIIQGIAELVLDDAQGRGVLVMVDDVAKMDTSSIAVVMHLVLSGMAKLLVVARSSEELPEDLVWLIKDHLLSHTTLGNFTRGEVRSLFTAAMGGPVAASLVEFLHSHSGGNPLILHALVHEHIRLGNIRQQNTTWVLNGTHRPSPSVLLEELVENRLARESSAARQGIEKMALMERAPLSLVMDVLGPEVVAELEEHHYLDIGKDGRSCTSLAEPHIAETVRTRMDVERKALLYKEIEPLLSRHSESLSDQELLVFAVWAQEARIPLEPEVALAAAKAGVQYFDPLRALSCTSALAGDEAWAAEAALVRSSAYAILADHPKALEALERVRGLVESGPDVLAYATWVAARCNALLWVDGGAERIPGLLDVARTRIGAPAAGTPGLQHTHKRGPQQEQALRELELARFEYQVHQGLFAEAAPGLEAAYQGLETSYLSSPSAEYRLNCGNLLVMAWAVTGREVDAIALARDIGRAAKKSPAPLRHPDLYNQGLLLALTWTGQWQESVSAVTDVLSAMRKSSEFHGGIAELNLGICHVYAGKGMEALDFLVAAAAQLEIRDMYNCTQLAYAALALASAQVHDTVEAQRYLRRAQALRPNTTWVNAAMTGFFTLLAQRWMDQPHAGRNLVELAARDNAAGRYTMASMALFGATVDGKEDNLRQLVQVTAKRQGPMARLTLVLANACLAKDPGQALAAAALAEELDLPGVESRCAVMALDLARMAGQPRLAREAEARVERLLRTIHVLPLSPQTQGDRLTQRERQVAKLAGRGMGNRAIAEIMGVSVRTVEGHLYQVFAKYGIASRSELSGIA